MSGTEAALQERIARAKADATLAERELDEAIRAIVELPRAQKQAVSKLVEAALARVRVVRAELAVLQEIATPAGDPTPGDTPGDTPADQPA